MLELEDRHIDELKHILADYVPEYDVWAFGSRVSGNAKKYSDLDLAVITDEPLSATHLRRLKDAFSESNLPIRVDVVDWADIDDSFRDIIDADRVPLQQAAADARS